MAWNFVIQAAIMVVSIALSFILSPKQQVQKLKPADSVDVPETKDGAELPVLFGTVLRKNPNVVWHGHIKTKAIKSKGGKK